MDSGGRLYVHDAINIQGYPFLGFSLSFSVY